MKAKLLAVLSAVLLMAGCQAEQTNDEIPQDEVRIDIETENADNHEDGEVVNKVNEADESKTDDQESVQDDAGSSDQERNPDDNKKEKSQTVNNDINKTHDEITVGVPPEEAGLESIEEEWLGGIPDGDIKGGILEACNVLYEIERGLNADDLEILEFDNIYECYWVQKESLSSFENVHDLLGGYFTEDVIQDLIEKWNLIEYDGRLIAPELPRFSGYDPSTIELKLAEVDDEAVERFINIGFADARGVSQRTLVVLKRSEDGSWKLDTIPGTGIVKQHGNAIIRNKLWIDGDVQWEWPEFIATEDRVWIDVLKPVKEDLKAKTSLALESFEPEQAFEAIGASQLKYWTTWSYSDVNPEYPSVDITLSEYVKYGIHPNHFRMTVTLAKDKQVALTLDDLYSEQESFYETVNVYIDKYMRENPDGFYDGVLFEGVSEETQFYITNHGIVFYFQLYEYAPYAFGYPEIEVAFEELKDSLAPEFLKFLDSDADEHVEEPAEELIEEEKDE